jgi:sterol desaturase/sphingolipid hydroxylase (fatty acid hydroxylase superfamily)
MLRGRGVESYLVVYVGLALLWPLVALFERRAPATRLVRTKRGLTVDLAYWVITPLLTGTLARVLTLGVIATLGLSLGFGTDGPAFLARIERVTPFAKLPFLASFLLALLVADFLGYLSHRLRHTARLWRVHAVHHATTELTAIAAARLHPLDEAIDSLCISVPVILMGFPLPVFAALGPFFVLHTLLLHANVSWTFGPLGRVLSSPRFHRRHHAEGLPAVNFGGVFAFYDVFFGTFEMPTEDPQTFGVVERDVPGSVAGQLAYPFKRAWHALR